MADQQVTEEEIALCSSILNRIHHSKLLDDRYATLLESGRALFKRQILKDRFGEEDALAFLAEMHGQKLVLKKLEKLQAEINLAHASRVDEAMNCKINQNREQSMLNIAAACVEGDAPGHLQLTEPGAGAGAGENGRVPALTDGKTYKYSCLGDDCSELFEVWEPCLRHMEVCPSYLARANRTDAAAPTRGTNRKVQPSHQLSGVKAVKILKEERIRAEIKSWDFEPGLCPFHGTHPVIECPKVTGRHFKTGEETGLDFCGVVTLDDCRAIYEVCNGRHYTDLKVLGTAEEWQRRWAKRLAAAEEAETEAEQVKVGLGSLGVQQVDEVEDACVVVEEELSLQVQVHGSAVSSTSVSLGPVTEDDFRAPDLPTREAQRLRESSFRSRSTTPGTGSGEEGGRSSADSSSARVQPNLTIPRGSFRRSCNTCNRSYAAVHSFYHQLCAPCGDFNMTKREQTADLTGYVAIVTGGRVRIGYEIVLKLLRAGATVLATSRYPQDMALRFSKEKDFSTWRHRLEAFGPLELADVPAVEAFCEAVARRWSRIHILINNAAQTLTRRTGWAARMAQLEYDAAIKMSPEGRETLLTLPGVAAQCTPALLPLALVGPSGPDPAADPDSVVGQAARQLYATAVLPVEADGDVNVEDVCMPSPSPSQPQPSLTSSSSFSSPAHPEMSPQTQPQNEHLSVIAIAAASSTSHLATSISTYQQQAGAGTLAVPSDLTIDLSHFPAGVLDESRQPLDLSRENSWRQRLGEVSTGEMLHTLAANAVAPFVLCSRLLPLLAPSDSDFTTDDAASVDETDMKADRAWGHIINVSALEGKFTVGKKSSGHPHTNMAKAALNMLTCTSASVYKQRHVLMNAVDTGWVTDNAPGGLGPKAKKHETHVGPPLDEVDGAARVLDPIFMHINSHTEWREVGLFWRNYKVSTW